ncbi:hypothetical protein ERHA54_50480 (plasmid) [Erwinia rhapontici]|nr:hypothetical protein ERHA54_50480 [Erwinia rhapontici]
MGVSIARVSSSVLPSGGAAQNCQRLSPEREILICDPTPTFQCMPPFTSLPYCSPYLAVDVIKDIFVHNMLMISRPSKYQGI